MRWSFAFALLLAAVPPPTTDEVWAVRSPDGHNTISVSLRARGRLVWRASRDSHQLLEDSPMGIRRADQSFESGLRFVGASPIRTIDERYTMPFGKRRDHYVAGLERTLTFANASGAKLAIVLRAHDDGVAFRYRFPEAAPGLKKTVVHESTGFQVPAGSTAWMLPQQEAFKYGPAYEDFFRQVTAGASSERPQGWDFPALFRTPAKQWLLITESALDETYCGTHLAQDASGGLYRIKFPDPQEGLGVGRAEPESTLPWTMPWRVVVMGDRAGQIAESDLVLDLAPATSFAATNWIKPGRAAWSWWSSDSPKHAEDLNAFTDLAAEMGWEYALVDANWNLMESGTIEDVIAHAKAKNVGLFFWYNSGGPHNDVTEAPRDRMFMREARREEFAKLKAWGARGVKVDFWHSDKQDRIKQYRDLLRDAADFNLMVNFHGSTIPRGWSREFPNLIGMEAVFGAERSKFRDFYPATAPWHNTVLPFTRNAIGPMDFTPVTFSDAQFPHTTTNAHELALSVIFENGIQHFADSVESYRSVPVEVKAFLSSVPSAWDEPRVLAGEPGRTVVIARRDRGIWYVGGINGSEAPAAAEVDASFLRDGVWRGATVADMPWVGKAAENDRQFRVGGVTNLRPTDTWRTDMGPHGGFVMRLERSLDEVAGKGLAQHDFLDCGEWDTRRPVQTMAIVRGGRIVWSYDIPNAEEYGDCTMLDNGNIVFSRKAGASEITPEKAIVWNYEAPRGFEVHTALPVGGDRVLVMQNGSPAKAMLIEKASNRVVKELTLPTRRPENAHGQFRHVRLTPDGHLLVAHLDLGRVVEYDWDGRQLWSVDAPSAWAAVRLPNGNTLISGNQWGDEREVDGQGHIVWSLEKDDLPGVPLHTVQEVTRLANGNTLINNWAGNRPKSEWPDIVQLIEVTPDKRIVWALRDWVRFGPASSTELLDQGGYR